MWPGVCSGVLLSCTDKLNRRTLLLRQAKHQDPFSHFSAFFPPVSASVLPLIWQLRVSNSLHTHTQTEYWTFLINLYTIPSTPLIFWLKKKKLFYWLFFIFIWNSRVSPLCVFSVGCWMLCFLTKLSGKSNSFFAILFILYKLMLFWRVWS